MLQTQPIWVSWDHFRTVAIFLSLSVIRLYLSLIEITTTSVAANRLCNWQLLHAPPASSIDVYVLYVLVHYLRA